MALAGAVERLDREVQSLRQPAQERPALAGLPDAVQRLVERDDERRVHPVQEPLERPALGLAERLRARSSTPRSAVPSRARKLRFRSTPWAFCRSSAATPSGLIVGITHRFTSLTGSPSAQRVDDGDPGLLVAVHGAEDHRRRPRVRVAQVVRADRPVLDARADAAYADDGLGSPATEWIVPARAPDLAARTTGPSAPARDGGEHGDSTRRGQRQGTVSAEPEARAPGGARSCRSR